MSQVSRREFVVVSAVAAALATRCLRVEGNETAAGHVNIASAAEPGERLVISGKVFDANGHPLSGVEVYAYHTDANGLYRPDRQVPEWPARPPHLEGRLHTATDGSYVIRTIRPAPYPGGTNPAHVHFRLRRPGGEVEGAAVWFKGDPLLSRENIEKYGSGPFAAICSLERGADGVLRCRRDFQLVAQPGKELR